MLKKYTLFAIAVALLIAMAAIAPISASQDSRKTPTPTPEVIMSGSGRLFPKERTSKQGASPLPTPACPQVCGSVTYWYCAPTCIMPTPQGHCGIEIPCDLSQ